MEAKESTELKPREWIKLLSQKFRKSDERVIITGNFRNAIKINKEDWNNYFKDFKGIGFRNGKAIEIISEKNSGSKAQLPDWAKERMDSIPGPLHCITEKQGKYFLKKLELIEQHTVIPGHIIIDSFQPFHVKREYSLQNDINKIVLPYLHGLLKKMGKFKYNPLTALKKARGMTGLLARREFFGNITKEDEAFISYYKKKLEGTQMDDGSWDQNTVTTAYNIIQLIELGTSSKDPIIKKAAAWLLSSPDPVGFPGLFMLSSSLTERFNAWKSRQKRGNPARPHRSSTAKEDKLYLESRSISFQHIISSLRIASYMVNRSCIGNSSPVRFA